MDSFYSIIYYKTNALTDELVAIGMLAGGGEGPFVYFSPARLDLIKKVNHPNTSLSLRRHIKYLTEKVYKYRKESNGILLFDPVFSNEQLEALAKNTKGAIVYSEPVTINEWLNTSFFEDLTRTFIGEKRRKTQNRPVFHLKWKAYYRSSVFQEWEKDVPLASLIDSYIMNIKIDVVNQKERRMIKGIDFDLSLTHLNRKIYEIELLKSALSNYQLLIVHPTPKKKSGKDAFQSMKQRFQKIEYKTLSQLKKIV